MLSRFTTYGSNQSAQLQRLARILKFAYYSFSYYTIQRVNNEALIKLHGCTGWSSSLLFACDKVRVSRIEAHIYSLVFAYWVFACFLSSADFFFKINFLKNYFRNPPECQTVLDPDQARQNVGPDLGPNCLQRLLADDTSR